MARSAQDPDPQLDDGPGRTRSGIQFAIGPPASPTIHRVQPAVNAADLSFRRVSRDTLFYAEEGVERDGPLDEAAGLLPDLAQLFEALSFGFKETPPLSSSSVNRVIKAILQPLSARDTDNFDPIIQAVTDFDYLAFRVAQVEQESSEPLASDLKIDLENGKYDLLEI